MGVSILVRRMRSLVLRVARSSACLLRIARIKLLCDGVSVPWSVSLGQGVRLHATDGGTIVIGRRTAISAGSQVVAQGGEMSIGADCFIGVGCILTCKSRMDVGDDVLLAEYVTVRDQDHAFPLGAKIRGSGFDCAPVVIGSNVWVGAKSTVLRGAHVGSGAVIGAHSLVRGSVPENAVAAGTPARVVRERACA